MRQTLVALADVLTPGSWGPTRPAPNLTYADLLELRELAHDVLLHRDTSERLKHPIFQELSVYLRKGQHFTFLGCFSLLGPTVRGMEGGFRTQLGSLSHPHGDRFLATDHGRHGR